MQGIRGRMGLAPLLLALCAGSPAAAEWRWPAPGEAVHAIALFGGEGTERNFSDTVHRLTDFQGSSERLAAVAYTRVLGGYGDLVTVEAEAMYGWHYGREQYHEVGAALNVRLHVLPLRELVHASLAVGLGPSYTTVRPELERQDSGADSARLLNQLNLELTLAAPPLPRTELLFRLQHRSGVFGLFNGITDASNFLAVGLRQRF